MPSRGYQQQERLLSVLCDYAPTNDAAQIVSDGYNAMIRDGMTDGAIEAALAGAIVDGLNHGNWPWNQRLWGRAKGE
jgi:hypothetical protein